MRQKDLVKQISFLVKTNKISEPFKSTDFPFLAKSLGFLAKHSVGNKGGYNEYFIRISRGLYELKK